MPHKRVSDPYTERRILLAINIFKQYHLQVSEQLRPHTIPRIQLPYNVPKANSHAANIN
jgi:hypothetical protein